MRIIAGTARGRRLAVPEGESVRPTGDRVREALFSSISANLRGAVVLDLFAGTGALGLEALSRGAASATFVERDRDTLQVVQANVRAAGFTDRSEVVAQRALSWLRSSPSVAVSLAFLDPPYAMGEEELAEVLEALLPRLAPDALVVVERDRASPVPTFPPDLQPTGDRAYGSTRLHRAVHAVKTGGGETL